MVGVNKTFLAPAKINLCLHVLGKRSDGYHELAMLMQRVSLYDSIHIALVSGPGVRVACDGLDLAAGEENIAAKAARRMIELAGYGGGVEIAIDKQIPVAAGLGGGSSDAAAVLMGLNEMLGCELSRDALMAEGVRLGADVPFFIFKDAAWATGIGEVLQPVEGLPRPWYVLVNPGEAVSTAWVYGNLGLTSKVDVAKLPRFSSQLNEVLGLLHNDLESVTVRQVPAVLEIKDQLLAKGALGALMSGSGSTVFGIFADKVRAKRACDELGAVGGWRSFLVESL